MLSISLTFWISTPCARTHAHTHSCVCDITWWIFALLGYARTCLYRRLHHIAWIWFQIYAYRCGSFFLEFRMTHQFSIVWIFFFEISAVMKFPLRFDFFGLHFLCYHDNDFWFVIQWKKNESLQIVRWRSHFSTPNFWLWGKNKQTNEHVVRNTNKYHGFSSSV